MSIVTLPQKTMTSVELVEIINALRKPGSKELRHDNFIAKIEKHPGIDAPKFVGTQAYGNRNTRKVYNLPERECKLMVMSESLEVQTKVYDRMTELEAKAPAVVHDPVLAAHIATLMRLDVVQQEQKRQDTAIAKIAETVAVIEARTQPENKHFTVMGWANLQGMKVDITAAANLGKRCANLSREQGVPIGNVSDPRFGKVYSYHESILNQVVALMDSAGAATKTVAA